jgi:uncharacterized repeat protein (TIGR02543 family)
MSLGERRRKLRAAIVLSLAAVLVTCLGPGSVLAARTLGPTSATPLAKSKKKCKARKRGKARKKCRRQAPQTPSQVTPSQVTLTVASDLPGAGTIDSSPAGISCGTVCTTKFASGTPVHLAATDNSDYFQVGWTGASCSGRGACDLVLNSDTSVVAHFLERVTVTADAGAGGTVEVTAPDAPFSVCTDATTCTVNSGDDVAVTATPDAGYTFYGWTGDCSGTDPVASLSSIAAPGKDCHATFATTLSVNGGGSGFGSITSSPAGIDCPPTCTASFPVGTVVTLTLNAGDGQTYGGWHDACEGNVGQTCTRTINGPTSITGDFWAYDPGGPPT